MTIHLLIALSALILAVISIYSTINVKKDKNKDKIRKFKVRSFGMDSEMIVTKEQVKFK